MLGFRVQVGPSGVNPGHRTASPETRTLNATTMRVGFVVNQIETEQATFTTTRLAMAAVNRGHESWLIGTGDLALDPDDYVRARAVGDEIEVQIARQLSRRCAWSKRAGGADYGR